MKPSKEEVDVEIMDVVPFKHGKTYDIDIEYAGNIGFGCYTLVLKDDKILGMSEHMDTPDDKWFLKKLFDKILEKVEVQE